MHLKMCLKNTVNTAVGIIRCGSIDCQLDLIEKILRDLQSTLLGVSVRLFLEIRSLRL